eukprot:4488926-Pyramimonas_sp.AAC.1
MLRCARQRSRSRRAVLCLCHAASAEDQPLAQRGYSFGCLPLPRGRCSRPWRRRPGAASSSAS